MQSMYRRNWLFAPDCKTAALAIVPCAIPYSLHPGLFSHMDPHLQPVVFYSLNTLLPRALQVWGPVPSLGLSTFDV